jgi:transmembrane sensor
LSPIDDALIARALRGEASADERERLAQWRAESADNDRRYEAVARLLDAARELPRPRLPRPRGTRPTAAAIIARSTRHHSAPNEWRRWVPWAVAAAAIIGAAVAVLRRSAMETLGADVVTGATELATVELRDGSVVRLAPSSRLRLRGMRAVELTGRAFFAVAKMPGRPFIVRTQFAAAQALGTRFEITTRRDDLRLTVVEGRVALSTVSNRVEVNAGETSDVGRGAASAPVAARDTAVRWIGNFLAFQATPLREAIREVERLHGVHVDIRDSMLAQQTVTATFTDQNAQQVMTVLCSILNARCDNGPNEIIMSRR